MTDSPDRIAAIREVVARFDEYPPDEIESLAAAYAAAVLDDLSTARTCAKALLDRLQQIEQERDKAISDAEIGRRLAEAAHAGRIAAESRLAQLEGALRLLLLFFGQQIDNGDVFRWTEWAMRLFPQNPPEYVSQDHVEQALRAILTKQGANTP